MERPSWGEIGAEGALIPGTHRLQPQVLELIKQMQIPILRFPGGTDVDFLDWRDMIDNVPGRGTQRPVSTGHRGHMITNNFGYDEFLQLCEDINAEVILVVNFRDALLEKKPLKEAAMHAASLVAYCNAPVGAKLLNGKYDWPSIRAKKGRFKPYRVKYFQIGNETWAFVRELMGLLPETGPDFYVKCLAAYIEAMRSVDPSIEIIVDGHDGNMSGIVEKVRKHFASEISYFATHFYSPWRIRGVTRNGNEIPINALSVNEIWYAWVAMPQFDEDGQSVLRHPGINAARSLDYKVAVTEWNWNGWWAHRGLKPALDSSFAKGLGAAGYLHAFMRAGDVIKVGCQSMLVGNSWGITAIRADAKGKIPSFYMPTGQVTMFYSKHHGDRLLTTISKNVPAYQQPYRMGGIAATKQIACIDAVATENDKAVYFHAINRHFQESIHITIDVSAFDGLKNRAVHHVLEGRLNDMPRPDESNQIGRIRQRQIRFDGRSLKVTLPRRSISCIEFMKK
ncbi:MAG: alpha-L-arabinofuranosidase C-terminal domain-containing protein [Phycisphaerae bacterium]